MVDSDISNVNLARLAKGRLKLKDKAFLSKSFVPEEHYFDK